MSDNNHFQHLFTEDIYVLGSAIEAETENQKEAKTVEEPTATYTKEEPVAKVKEEIETSKFDLSKIYIFSDYEITKPEKHFLAKILKAVNVDLHSIKVAEWDRDAKEFPNKNFVFNSQITDCGLTGKRISAPPLNEIEQNIELKKALWENMQKLFL